MLQTLSLRSRSVTKERQILAPANENTVGWASVISRVTATARMIMRQSVTDKLGQY